MFRIFEGPTADQIWQQLAEAFRVDDGVVVQPSRAGATKELLHVAISVDDPRQRWAASRIPPLNAAFAIAEVVWIMAGRNDLAFLEPWNSKLPDYVGSGPLLHGAYGYRLRNHLSGDQLTKAYLALSNAPDTRQVVLQIWDSSIDLPQADGAPASQDVPCNLMSLLKVRAGKLDWLQIIRSNDLFLGMPYNFVQFMTIQEVMAGWLGVECGTYHQVSDSLHLYERDAVRVLNSAPQEQLPRNADSLALPKEDSEAAFLELTRRMEHMIEPGLSQVRLEQTADWSEGPEAFRNMLAVLGCEMARRRGWLDSTDRMMASCSNPLFRELWRRWMKSAGT